MFEDLGLIPSTAQTVLLILTLRKERQKDESLRLSSKFKVYPRYVEPYVKTKCGIDGKKE